MIALIGITIERKLKSISRNESPSTKANTIGVLVFIVSLKSAVAAASPVTAAVTPPPSLSNAAGTVVSRSWCMPFMAASLTPDAREADVDDGDVVLRVDVDVDRVELLDRGLDLGRVDVLGLHDDHRVVGLARERLLDLQVRLDDRLGLGLGLDARELGLHAQRGDGEGDERAAGEDDRPSSGGA